jgi:Ran GTPase-activating protein (RanGAP) involved in mRNA processing and transport
LVSAALTELNLGSNRIGDSGAIGLGKALEVNATLTELNLSWNNIGDSGAISLGKGLAVNATLTTLSLLGNNFADTSKSAVRTAWQSKTGRQSGLYI